jgi:hypothetical protein
VSRKRLPSNQKFLFVNKSAKSRNMTRSEGRERLKMLSHVQRDFLSPCVDRRHGVLKSPKPSVREFMEAFIAEHATDGSSKTTWSIPQRLKRTNLSAHNAPASVCIFHTKTTS